MSNLARFLGRVSSPSAARFRKLASEGRWRFPERGARFRAALAQDEFVVRGEAANLLVGERESSGRVRDFARGRVHAKSGHARRGQRPTGGAAMARCRGNRAPCACGELRSRVEARLNPAGEFRSTVSTRCVCHTIWVTAREIDDAAEFLAVRPSERSRSFLAAGNSGGGRVQHGAGRRCE